MTGKRKRPWRLTTVQGFVLPHVPTSLTTCGPRISEAIGKMCDDWVLREGPPFPVYRWDVSIYVQSRTALGHISQGHLEYRSFLNVTSHSGRPSLPLPNARERQAAKKWSSHTVSLAAHDQLFFQEVLTEGLTHWLFRWPQTSSSNISWRFVKNANSQALHTYRIRNFGRAGWGPGVHSLSLLGDSDMG